jgi:chorismate mutase
MAKMKKQQQLQEPTAAEAERQKAKLAELFKEHKLDAEKHKGFFDALIEWKRHL